MCEALSLFLMPPLHPPSPLVLPLTLKKGSFFFGEGGYKVVVFAFGELYTLLYIIIMFQVEILITIFFFRNLSRPHLETRGVFFSNISRTIAWESSKKPPCTVAALSSTQDFHRLASSCQAFTSVNPKRHLICRPNSMPTSLQESASNGDNSLEGENPPIDSEVETLAQPPTREQVFFIQLTTVFLKSHNYHLITDMFLTLKTAEI